MLPAGVPTLSVEAATTFGWERWVDARPRHDRFGASAPGRSPWSKLGFTPIDVAALGPCPARLTARRTR